MSPPPFETKYDSANSRIVTPSATSNSSGGSSSSNYIDLYLIHWPGAAKTAPTDRQNYWYRRQAWLTLQQARDMGKIREIGVSNYCISHLEEMKSYTAETPAVNQVEYHPLNFSGQEQLVRYMKENGIRLDAYSSLGQGSPLLLSSATVADIAAVLNKTNGQVLLRWALQHGCTVLPKTSSLHRLKENFELDFSLTLDQMNQLDRLFSLSAPLGPASPNCVAQNLGYVKFAWDPANIPAFPDMKPTS